MSFELFWRRVHTNLSARYDQTVTFKAQILFDLLTVVLQVAMWYFMARIVDSSTLGYPVNYIAFIFVGSLAAFLVTEAGSSLSGSFSRDMSAGLMKLAYISNMDITEYFLINFFTNIVFSLFLYIIPLIITFMIVSHYSGDAAVFYLGPWNIFTLVMAVLVFIIGNLGITLMSMGSTLYLKEGDPVSFTVEQLNNFFSGQLFPLSILPKYLLFIPQILPTAYIILIWRDTLFLDKTLINSELFSLSMVSLVINIVVFAIGYYMFYRGVRRAKLEGRWM